jgi:hypothetical protein
VTAQSCSSELRCKDRFNVGDDATSASMLRTIISVIGTSVTLER